MFKQLSNRFRIIILILFVLILSSPKLSFSESISSDTSRIYHFRIMQEIGPAAWRQTLKAFEEAHKINASHMIIHMNTYGGLVDAADSIRTKILNSKLPVYVFIDNNAASAGALIAIACDKIFMRTGSNIGSATVVTQDGTPAPDKYQAYMRATMRSTAEAHGKRIEILNGDTIETWVRDPRIAEAMVDPSIYIENIIDSGKVITFTASEAMKHGYCEGMAESIHEVIEKLGIAEYQIVEYIPTRIEKVIDFLINPIFQGIIIMIIIGGIYFELQSPGIGFPLAASVGAAILYFAPLYLEGIAQNWEILMFIGGIILLGIEIFAVPGFGITGVAGIILMITGLALGMVDNIVFQFDGRWIPEVVKSFSIVLFSTFVSLIGSIFLARKLFENDALPYLTLNTVQDKNEGYVAADITYYALAGKMGTAYTDLRPSGRIEVDGEIYDAVAETGFIERYSSIVIVKYETGQLYVRKNI